MGAVFKARHLKLNKVVAVKVIRQEYLKRPEVVRRFRREIQAVAQLHHPNVIRAFDADQVGERHFLVMEYRQGIDLARKVNRDGPVAGSSSRGKCRGCQCAASWSRRCFV